MKKYGRKWRKLHKTDPDFMRKRPSYPTPKKRPPCKPLTEFEEINLRETPRTKAEIAILRKQAYKVLAQDEIYEKQERMREEKRAPLPYVLTCVSIITTYGRFIVPPLKERLVGLCIGSLNYFDCLFGLPKKGEHPYYHYIEPSGYDVVKDGISKACKQYIDILCEATEGTTRHTRVHKRAVVGDRIEAAYRKILKL